MHITFLLFEFLHTSMQMTSNLTNFVKLNVVNSAMSNDSIFPIVQGFVSIY